MDLEIALKQKKILLYKGKHNVHYVFFYKNKKYILRLKKNLDTKIKNEISFLSKSKSKSILYLDKQYLIKEYTEARRLKKAKLKYLIKIKKELQSVFWSKEIKIDSINYLENEINDLEYSKKLNKYKNDFSDKKICHNDLRKKNILVLKNSKKIELIDFEWVRFNDIYFDLAHLYLYCNFSLKQIKKVFQINKSKFFDFVYICKVFNKHFEKTFYSSLSSEKSSSV